MREKAELRKRVRALRDATPAEMHARWSAQICACALAHPAYARARTVHIFLAFQSEVDTRAIIEHALSNGRRVVVPVFLKDSNETPATQIDTLDPAAFDFGRWDLRTPKLRRDAPLNEIDLVFAPLLVFAATGAGRCARIGYGAGYYDRLLARLDPRVPRIGLAFALQRVENPPIEAHDQFLDEVLTEECM